MRGAGSPGGHLCEKRTTIVKLRKGPKSTSFSRLWKGVVSGSAAGEGWSSGFRV